MAERKKKQNPKSFQQTERVLALVAILTIIVAWFIGAARAGSDVFPYLAQAFPDAGYFHPETNDIYAVYENSAQENPIGYVGIASDNGYGGPLKVAVGVDLEGQVVGVVVVETKETAAWVARINESDLFENLTGKAYSDPFELNQDVDVISGATYSTRAIVNSTRTAIRQIAKDELAFSVPEEKPPDIIFGVPEIALLGLFAVGYFGHQKNFKYTKQVRWISMLAGLLILGFMYNNPLSIAFINKLLIGYFPDWRTNLYWYMLIGGILFVYTVDNKNPYCEWFCPFGAVQECFGAVGGAKVRTPRQYRDLFTWMQRGLSWFAIVAALIFRSPGLTSYEVFGTMFDLLGSSVQFALLGMILVASLFMRRPWCSYLCPLRPVTDLIRLVRRWVLEKWQTLNRKTAT